MGTAAHSHGLASMVITFGEHPRQVLQSDYCPHLLTTPEERLSLLSTTGVDCCVVLPFDLEMASLSARSFMDTVLKQTLHVERLHIGYDHHFGHDRSEGFEQYVGYGRDLGITVVHEEGLRLSAFMNQIPANLSGETAVSSSLVRRLLSEGLVDEAAILLGRFYDITGLSRTGSPARSMSRSCVVISVLPMRSGMRTLLAGMSVISFVLRSMLM